MRRIRDGGAGAPIVSGPLNPVVELATTGERVRWFLLVLQWIWGCRLGDPLGRHAVAKNLQLK
jgi:hypothetical protein